MISHPETSPLFQPESEELSPLVLVIEDDCEIADLLCEVLERQGFRTQHTTRGETGWKFAQRIEPDVILLDLRLPDADGFELCQRMSDHEATCTIPVILLSGMEQPNVVNLSRRAGARFYVRKPYDIGALLILVEQALAESWEWEE